MRANMRRRKTPDEMRTTAARLWRWLTRQVPPHPEALDEASVIQLIRGHFAAFGYDLSDLSDAEITAGVLRIADTIAASKLTLAQAADALGHALEAEHASGDEDETC